MNHFNLELLWRICNIHNLNELYNINEEIDIWKKNTHVQANERKSSFLE